MAILKARIFANLKCISRLSWAISGRASAMNGLISTCVAHGEQSQNERVDVTGARVTASEC